MMMMASTNITTADANADDRAYYDNGGGSKMEGMMLNEGQNNDDDNSNNDCKLQLRDCRRVRRRSSSSSKTRNNLSWSPSSSSSSPMTMLLVVAIVVLSCSIGNISNNNDGNQRLDGSFFVSAQTLPAPLDKVYCLVCPNGRRATGTNFISGFQCQDIDEMGRGRAFSFDQCTDLQLRAAQPDDVCNCLVPDPTPQPTPHPTFNPTPAPTDATLQPTPVTDGRFPCNICRNGGILTLPEALLFGFGFMGMGVTCGQGQFLAGPLGPGFTLEQCGIAQALAVNTCGCPFEPDQPAQAPATVMPAMAPSAPGVFCTVCFNGNPSTSTQAIGGLQCGELDARARNFEFNSQECLEIQSAAAVAPDDPCACNPGPPTTQGPVAPTPPTDPPPTDVTVSPSSAPSLIPSASPSTPFPSSSPSITDLVVEWNLVIFDCTGWLIQLFRKDPGADNYVVDTTGGLNRGFTCVETLPNGTILVGEAGDLPFDSPPMGTEWILQVQNVNNIAGTGRYGPPGPTPSDPNDPEDSNVFLFQTQLVMNSNIPVVNEGAFWNEGFGNNQINLAANPDNNSGAICQVGWNTTNINCASCRYGSNGGTLNVVVPAFAGDTDNFTAAVVPQECNMSLPIV